jgi:hypothetical protein
MFWQLFIAILVPFVPVNPTFVRAYDTPKFRLVFECEGFETVFESARELVKENRDIISTMWSHMRLFYSETMAGKQLEKEA